MKFKHLLLLSVIFASLLISALLLISKPTAPEKTIALTAESSAHQYILPARHTPGPSTTMHHHL